MSEEFGRSGGRGRSQGRVARRRGGDAPRGGRTVRALVLASLLVSAACDRQPGPPPKPPETLAVEAKAGDFADYYSEVVRLARVHAAHPDSFRAALDALPGSHLTDEEWAAWVAPYEDSPGRLAAKLEEAISTVSPAE